MENPEGLIKIRKFRKLFYDVPAGLKQGSILMVSQQTCCKISFFYSAIQKLSLFFFFPETIFPSTVGKRKKQTNTLWMDSKSLICEDIVLEVVESILFFFLL